MSGRGLPSCAPSPRRDSIVEKIPHYLIPYFWLYQLTPHRPGISLFCIYIAPGVRGNPQPRYYAHLIMTDSAQKGIRKIAFIGDYLPRKCGIATFTSDLLGAIAAESPENQCFA